jgi:hypothetical protein
MQEMQPEAMWSTMLKNLEELVNFRDIMKGYYGFNSSYSWRSSMCTMALQ